MRSVWGPVCFHWPSVIRAVSKLCGWENATSSVTVRLPAPAREDVGARQLLQVGDRVRRADVEGERVLGIGEVRLERDGLGLRPGGLHLAGHQRHRVAERVEHVAVVAVRAECPGRVRLATRVRRSGPGRSATTMNEPTSLWLWLTPLSLPMMAVASLPEEPLSGRQIRMPACANQERGPPTSTGVAAGGRCLRSPGPGTGTSIPSARPLAAEPDPPARRPSADRTRGARSGNP